MIHPLRLDWQVVAVAILALGWPLCLGQLQKWRESRRLYRPATPEMRLPVGWNCWHLWKGRLYLWKWDGRQWRYTGVCGKGADVPDTEEA